MSGHADRIAQRLEAQGSRMAILVKPFTPAELCAAVRACCDARRAPPSATESHA